MGILLQGECAAAAAHPGIFVNLNFDYFRELEFRLFFVKLNLTRCQAKGLARDPREIADADGNIPMPMIRKDITFLSSKIHLRSSSVSRGGAASSSSAPSRVNLSHLEIPVISTRFHTPPTVLRKLNSPLQDTWTEQASGEDGNACMLQRESIPVQDVQCCTHITFKETERCSRNSSTSQLASPRSWLPCVCARRGASEALKGSSAQSGSF